MEEESINPTNNGDCLYSQMGKWEGGGWFVKYEVNSCDIYIENY